MKELNITEIYCKTIEAMSHDYMKMTSRQSKKILKFTKSKRMNIFLQKTKLILEEKLIYIAKSLKLKELIIEISMVPQNPQKINKCEFLFDICIQNNKKETIGFINDDMFDDYFYVTAKELKKPNNFRVCKLFEEKPIDEWFVVSPFYEKNKHLDSITKRLKIYHSEQIDENGFKHLKSIFNMDSYLNEFLTMLHTQNFFDFKDIDFVESKYHIGVESYLYLCFVRKEQESYYSGTLKQNYESKADFENDIVSAFIQMRLIHSSITKEDYNNLEELFTLNKVLTY